MIQGQYQEIDKNKCISQKRGVSWGHRMVELCLGVLEAAARRSRGSAPWEIWISNFWDTLKLHFWSIKKQFYHDSKTIYGTYGPIKQKYSSFISKEKPLQTFKNIDAILLHQQKTKDWRNSFISYTCSLLQENPCNIWKSYI